MHCKEREEFADDRRKSQGGLTCTFQRNKRMLHFYARIEPYVLFLVSVKAILDEALFK